MYLIYTPQRPSPDTATLTAHTTSTLEKRKQEEIPILEGTGI